MKTVNIHEAKTHLSRLLDQVSKGDEVIIAKAGRPIAKLVPYHPARRGRVPGTEKGKIWISEDFTAWTPELEKDFFGGDDHL